MNRISPVWILTSLTDEAFNKFKEAIDQQFKAFSETELNGFQDCETHRWWGVESIAGGLDGRWSQQTGFPNNVPAYLPTNYGLFNGQQSLVIFYAPLEDFSEDSNNHIRKLKENALFFHTHQDRFFYGLTSFRKEESAKSSFLDLVGKIESDELNNRVYDSITFLSDSSHSTGDNPHGYLDLNEDDFMALVVNIIFAIAITKRTLYQVCNDQNRLFNTAGVFSFTYELDALRKSKAYCLSKQLLDAFCTNEQDADWCSQNDAKTHFDVSDIKKFIHWHNIYTQLRLGFEEESMKGLYPSCEISPWEMFSYKLVPLYFKRFVKSAIRKIYDNVHDFASVTQMRYEVFVGNKCQQLLDGTAEVESKQLYAKTAIADYLSSIWSPSYHGAKGVKQVLLLLGKIREYIEKQKKELIRVRGFQEPNDDKHRGFPKMEDYPLQEIAKDENKKYYSHYKELVANGEPKAKFDIDANKSYEERSLIKIQKLFQWHAMPLNLFTKAGLLSVLIFVSVWSLISIIQSSNLVHIFALDSNWCLIGLFIAIAAIVQVFAFLKYGQKTLRKIREAMEEYIAWGFYKLQCEVYMLSIKEADKYYDALIEECDRIESQLKRFSDYKVEDVPSFGNYRISKFQRNILDKMDDGRQILNATVLRVFLSVNNVDFSADEVTRGLFDALLRDNYQQLSKEICNNVLKQTDGTDRKQLKTNLLKLWTDLLAEHVQVTINGQHGSTIDFPAFHNSNISNFTNEAWISANAIIYPSVYVYAIRPYSWIASIVPNGNGHQPGFKWENLFYGEGMTNQKIPDFANVQNPAGWLTTEHIALFLRIHAYDRLIVKTQNGLETTIFNNQLI